jgi:hypothetical protein
MKISTLFVLLPATALASDVLSVIFFAKEKKQLYDFISANSEIDYGCRPVVIPADGEHKLHAVIPEAELGELKRSLDARTIRVETLHNLNKRQTVTAPIGKGDRFKGGKVSPRGLGTRKPSEYAGLQSAGIFNADEVYTAMKGLEKQYGLTLFTPPHKTFEGNQVIGGVANKAEKIKKDKQYIYFTSGVSIPSHLLHTVNANVSRSTPAKEEDQTTSSTLYLICSMRTSTGLA